MPRLPQPGKDAGEWGTILNDFLSSSLSSDGSLKSNTVGSNQLQTGSVTTTALSDSAITTSKISDGSITAAKVAADVATQVELDSVAAAKADISHGHAQADIIGLTTALSAKLDVATATGTYARHDDAMRLLATTPSAYGAAPTSPTVTTGAANAASTLATGWTHYATTQGAYNVGAGTTVITDRPWRILGNLPRVLNPTAYGQADFVTGSILTGPFSSGGPFQVAYLTDAIEHEFVVRGGCVYRLLIDGKYITRDTVTVATSNGSVYRIKIAHSDRRMRRHVIDFRSSQSFGGIVVGANDTIVRPAQDPYRVAYVTDSIGGFYDHTQRHLGWGDDHVGSIAGGTGYLQPLTSGNVAPKFRDRFTHDVATYLTTPSDSFYQPIIVWAGGINDGAFTPAQVLAECQTLFSYANQQVPGVIQIALSSWWPRTPVDQNASDRSLAIKSAVEGVGGKYVDVLGYFTGNGKAGSASTTTPKGNGEIYITADGTHPNLDGLDYAGYRVAEGIRSVLAAVNRA